MADEKPKIIIGPGGTIHVDDKEKPKAPAGVKIDQDGTIHVVDASSKPITLPKKAAKNTGVKPDSALPANTKPSGKKSQSLSKTITDGALTIFGGILAILILGGVCAGIGLLVMSGLGMIPLVAFILIVVICALAGSGKSQ